VLEHEGDARVGERDTPEDLVAMAELGRLGPQELAARRRIEIEIRHRNRGALGARGRLDLADLRAFGPDRRGVRRLARAARDREPGNRGDRGKRLAAEAHRRHALEVLEARDLARGVAREREPQLFARDPRAVVLDLHPLGAARVERHRDCLRAGVDAVLQELLQHRGRPLHHLARGDLAHEQLGQNADGAHARWTSSPPVMRTSAP
jgi:hypothetical protein